VIGQARLNALLEAFGSLDDIFSASLPDLRSVEGIGKVTADRIVNWERHFSPEDEYKKARDRGAKIITAEDDEYPVLLKEIFDPPLVLYVRGKITNTERVAVVGTRRASIYGQQSAEKLGRGLVGFGLIVVSGMARGIDTAAHRGALAGGGKTIAVLGCGVDYVYPPENGKLMEEIVSNGAVVSEFPMGTKPYRQNFPRRNRIVSGMSRGVVVVEAPQRSGAIITVDFALEQGRDVYAVPGKVDSLTSQGTNWLIKQGAKLVDNAEDIAEDFGISAKNSAGAGGPEPGDSVSSLNPDERKVHELLSSDPVHIDEIAEKLEMSISKVSVILLSLEMKKFVKQLPGKMFVRS
jgi:DNA processing protein